MSKKQVPLSPLERGTRKMEVLMRTFGMRTRMFKGSTRAIVKGTRKTYPYELEATIVETARGVGIRVSAEKVWYTFLKLIPFVLMIALSIVQFAAPSAGENMENGIGINLFLLIFGPSPKLIGLWVVLPIFATIVIVSEILERMIRARYIQDRMPRFLSGAEWTVAEPPVILEIFSSSNQLFWLMWVMLIIIFAPLSFSEDIFTKFLEVYSASEGELLNGTLIISILDVGLISGMLFSIVYLNYEKFRLELDGQQRHKAITFENNIRQMIQVAIGATVLATFELSIFYFMFWSKISMLQTIIFYTITIVSSMIAVWLFWQKESYIFIGIEIYLFLSLVVMVFLNANHPGFSWMIICHLFLILFIVGLFANRLLENYLAKKGIYEPSWMFSPLPLIALIEVLRKPKAKISKGVEKDLEEIRAEEMLDKAKERTPLTIGLDKIKLKGEEAEKIIQIYQKIVKRIVKGEISIFTLSTLNKEIFSMLSDNKDLVQSAADLFNTIDRLLWEDKYKLSDGKEMLKIAERVYDEINKQR